MLARGHGLDVELRAVLRHHVLEQGVHLLDLFLELGAVLVGVAAEHRDGALVLARRDLLEIDAAVGQRAVEVRDLRQHADGADHGERRGDDAIGDAGHHVAAAGRTLVNNRRQRDAAASHPRELGRGEAVLVHGAAEVLQPQHDLVPRRGHRDDGVDLLAQGADGSGPDVALEIQHEDALAMFLLLRGGFFPRLAGSFSSFFGCLLPLGLRQHCAAQRPGELPVPLVELLDGQAAGRAALAREADDDQRHRPDRHHEGDCLGQEQAVLKEEFSH